MASDTASLQVVDMQGNLLSYLGLLDVEEAVAVSRNTLIYFQGILLDVMSCHVGDSEHKHSICHLPVEPDGLVQRQEPNLRANNPQ